MRKYLLLILILSMYGCSGISWESPFEHKEGGSRMVVIPFREGDNIHHFESSIGRDIAERMEDLIRDRAKEGTFRIVPFMNIGKEMIEELRNTAPGDIDWVKVGEAAKADLVMSGNITKFEVKRPRDLNLFAGTCKAKVFVIQTEDRARVYSKTHTVRHPEGELSLPYEVGPDAGEKMRTQLILKTAKECAEPFYPTAKKEED